MPEGHTIHRLAIDLGGLLAGREVRATSPQGRFVAGATVLDGACVTRTDAHGKHLFVGFAGVRGDGWLRVHLGLYGRFEIGEQPMPSPRGAVRLRLETATHGIDLRGPTACELVTEAEKQSVHARLGPDPLRHGARPDAAFARIARSTAAIGVLLMDQQVIAGVGNVYRAEVLYRAGLSPFRSGREVEPATVQAMWLDLRRLMRAGVRSGRILTTRAEHRPRRRGAVPREDSFYVYRRTGLPCRVCGTAVLTADMVGRNLYWCPGCQAP